MTSASGAQRNTRSPFWAIGASRYRAMSKAPKTASWSFKSARPQAVLHMREGSSTIQAVYERAKPVGAQDFLYSGTRRPRSAHCEQTGYVRCQSDLLYHSTGVGLQLRALAFAQLSHRLAALAAPKGKNRPRLRRRHQGSRVSPKN